MPKPKRSPTFTQSEIAHSLGLHRSTILKRFKSCEIEPNKHGRYTLANVVAAMVGDLNSERIAKIRAERELLELELEKERAQVANVADMELAWGNVVVSLRQAIKGSSMSQTEKEQTLTHIRASLTGDILKATNAAIVEQAEHPGRSSQGG